MEVEGNSRRALYGKVGGKIQVADPTTVEVGKNIGRANETTPADQCMAEAKALWEKKLKSGYVQTLDAAAMGASSDRVDGGAWPMLAKKYAEDGDKITWPAFCQPKLDGHRCIAVVDSDGKCTLWSRTRKPIRSVPHVVAAIEALGVKDAVFDGELYNHEYHDKFEELSHFIRQSTPSPGCEIVHYHIYDVVEEGLPFKQRLKLRDDLLRDATKEPLVPVATYVVNDEAEMLVLFDKFKADHYEGCMVRNAEGGYVSHPTHRSNDLQKVKSFDDAEFEITGVVAGVGKMSGCGIFVCKTKSGDRFEAKMVGKLDDLRQYLNNPSAVVGKMLTVKYQGFSKYNIPRFPVGLRIREPE